MCVPGVQWLQWQIQMKDYLGAKNYIILKAHQKYDNSNIIKASLWVQQWHD